LGPIVGLEMSQAQIPMTREGVGMGAWVLANAMHTIRNATASHNKRRGSDKVPENLPGSLSPFPPKKIGPEEADATKAMLKGRRILDGTCLTSCNGAFYSHAPTFLPSTIWLMLFCTHADNDLPSRLLFKVGNSRGGGSGRTPPPGRFACRPPSGRFRPSIQLASTLQPFPIPR